MPAAVLIIEYTPSGAQEAASPSQRAARAEQISEIEGLVWKYWLREPEKGGYGGVYLFSTLDLAISGGEMLEASLAQAGATGIRRRTFDVDAGLSAMTRGIVPD